MKTKTKSAASALLLSLMLVSWDLAAVETKPLENVNISDMTAETQKHTTGKEAGMRLAWWVPVEFWQAALSEGGQLSESSVKETVDTLSPYFMLAVVQADVSNFGAFDFYGKETIHKHMKVEYVDGSGRRRSLEVLKDIDPDFAMLQQQMTPMLASAMGNMGQNFHFFTFSDRTEKNQRIVSPYKRGKLLVTLTDREGKASSVFEFETLLDSLHVPRICSNGKRAHVSWTHCPWGGSRLPD